jgi:hypothetical protein
MEYLYPCRPPSPAYLESQYSCHSFQRASYDLRVFSGSSFSRWKRTAHSTVAETSWSQVRGREAVGPVAIGVVGAVVYAGKVREAEDPAAVAAVGDVGYDDDPGELLDGDPTTGDVENLL